MTGLILSAGINCLRVWIGMIYQYPLVSIVPSLIRNSLMDQVPFEVVGDEGEMYVLLHSRSPSRTIQICIFMRCLLVGLSTCNAEVALRVSGWLLWWSWLPAPSFQHNNTKIPLGVWCQTYFAYTHPSEYLLIPPPYSRPLFPSLNKWHVIYPRCKEVLHLCVPVFSSGHI